jgi:hypothetical protein
MIPVYKAFKLLIFSVFCPDPLGRNTKNQPVSKVTFRRFRGLVPF